MDNAPSSPKVHWGQAVVALIEAMEPTVWGAMDIPDVVAWVQEQRRKETERRGVHFDIDCETDLGKHEGTVNK